MFSSALGVVCWAALRSFAFRTRVAKSGLLAVPGERNMDRLFVCTSSSSASKKCSWDDVEVPEGDLERVRLIFGAMFDGEGVGGTTVGVEG